MILEIINIVCLALTVTGAAILGVKGDKIQGWVIYVIGATFGIAYFVSLIDAVQIALWSFFLVNDIGAIRRIRKQSKAWEAFVEQDKKPLDENRKRYLKHCLEIYNKNPIQQEYKSREFCHAINCSKQQTINEGIGNKEECKRACIKSAWQFHDWLQSNGYKIVKK
jgi:hypothetical protein